MLIKCYECGHDVSTTAAACVKCGAPQPQKFSCQKCQNELQTKDSICPNCDVKKEEKQESIKEQEKINAIKPEEKKPQYTPIKQDDTKQKKNKTALYITISSIGAILIVVIIVVLYMLNKETIQNQVYPDATSIDAETEMMEDSTATPEPEPEAAPVTEYEQVPNQNDQTVYIRNNIGEFVVAEQYGNYRLKVLGGIEGLQVKMTNNTDYVLDRVYVSVEIYKMNDELYTTKFLVFNDVQPNSWYIKDVPETVRGQSFKIFVSRVESSSLNLNSN